MIILDWFSPTAIVKFFLKDNLNGNSYKYRTKKIIWQYHLSCSNKKETDIMPPKVKRSGDRPLNFVIIGQEETAGK